MALPIRTPGPFAFIDPPIPGVSPLEAAGLAVAAATAAAAVLTIPIATPVVTGAAIGAGLYLASELLFPQSVGDDMPLEWGTINGPERNTVYTLPANLTGSVVGTYSPTGTNIVTGGGSFIGKQYVAPGNACPSSQVNFGPINQTITGGIVGFEVGKSGTGNCTGTNNRIDYWAIRADGSKVTLAFISGGGGWTSINANIGISSAAVDAKPVSDGLVPTAINPWLGVTDATIAAFGPVPEPIPLPTYPVQPQTLPVVPDAPVLPDPEVVPEPGRPLAPNPTITVPVPRPFAPPWVTPGGGSQSNPSIFPGPTGQPTRPTLPDSTVQPTQPGPVTQTQPGSIVPWPGAPVIPGTGVGPRPDLTSIAQEVGRIERKIDLMNTPGSGQNGFENLAELLGLLAQIWELLSAQASGTTFTLDSPCEVDDEGVKLPPIEVEAPGGLTYFEALTNRMDALAELIQVHKNLKQPGCKHRLAGEIVTVNFEQIE